MIKHPVYVTLSASLNKTFSSGVCHIMLHMNITQNKQNGNSLSIPSYLWFTKLHQHSFINPKG